MHFLLGISSIALFTFGSSLALRLLHGVGSWRHRRYVQCLVLSIPLASLGLGLVGLHHFTGRACLRDALAQSAWACCDSRLWRGSFSAEVFRLVLTFNRLLMSWRNAWGQSVPGYGSAPMIDRWR